MIPNWAIDEALLTPYEMMALAVIGRYMPNSFPSGPTISKKGCMSRRQVTYAINGLIKKGLIIKRNRLGTSNKYEYTSLYYNGREHGHEVHTPEHSLQAPPAPNALPPLQSVPPIQIDLNQIKLTKYTYPQNLQKRVCDSETLTRLIKAWGESLAIKGKSRDPHLDDHVLMRIYKARGEEAFDAIRGLGLEPSSPRFDAVANCYIERLLKPDGFSRLCSIGAKPKMAQWMLDAIAEEEKEKQNANA